MLSAPKPSILNSCDGLEDFALYFGGEHESLPVDCEPGQVREFPQSQPHPPAVTLVDYRKGLRNSAFVPRAIRMAFIIGSFVFAINHGKALLQNEMTRDRWFSGAVSFVTPYLVSIYGQTQCELGRASKED